MMTGKVVHCKREAYDVYIGRPGRWGNPYTHLPSAPEEFRVSSREEAIAMYEIWLKQQPELMAALGELKGKVLGCWCSPRPCHGDVLVRLAEDV